MANQLQKVTESSSRAGAAEGCSVAARDFTGENI